MVTIRRVTMIVLDSVGAGEAPDSAAFGDAGSNTLGNISCVVGGLHMPNMQAMGLGNILAIKGVPRVRQATAAYGRLQEVSAGKDTTIGHWELMGQVSKTPLPTYPEGFPPEVMSVFEERIGRKTLGNYAASGTVIIEELGEQHIATGFPIVYTSADSVFQIAAHEDVIPIEEQYRICRIAREVLSGEHNVGRVIARPFVGQPGRFTRTDRRRDFSALPPGPTLLDHFTDRGLPVMAVGKIEDIFAGQGITYAVHTHDNMDGVDKTLEYMRSGRGGFIFTNLVDFDMLFGHRNNPRGYADALEAFDRRVPEILEAMGDDEVLIITADHGCDPTTPSTDHSRELVPILLYGKTVRPAVDLGVRSSFSDLAATIAEWFAIEPPAYGTSFADLVQI